MDSYCTGVCKLTCDPETKQVGDTTVTKFRIAINGRIVKKGGQAVMENGYAKRETVYWACEAWNGQGENIAKGFKKGSRILLTGGFKQDEVEKDGGRQTYTTLRVSDFQYVDAKDDGGETPPAPQAAPAPKAPAPAKAKAKKPAEDHDGFGGADDGEIPF